MADISTCSFCNAPAVAGIPYCVGCGRAFVTAKPKQLQRGDGSKLSEASLKDTARQDLASAAMGTAGQKEVKGAFNAGLTGAAIGARERPESIREVKLERDTDPRFIAANKEFWKLRRDFEASVIGRSRFEEEVEKLKLRDETGGWWAIDPESGNWLRFDGRAWVLSAPPRVKPSPLKEPAPIPAREEVREKKQPERPAATAPAGAQVAEQIVCPACQTTVRIGNRFCQSCGFQVIRDQGRKAEKVPEAPPTPICSRCGNPLRSGLRFCTQCGASVAL
jgi:hypothetical protein